MISRNVTRTLAAGIATVIATLLVCAIFGAGYIFKLIDRLEREHHN